MTQLSDQDAAGPDRGNEQGLAIRAARLAKGMTQAHLAIAAATSEKTVRRAEAGDRISAENLRSLCVVLGIDAAALRREAETSPKVAEAERARRVLACTAVAVGILLPLIAGWTATVLLSMGYNVDFVRAVPSGGEWSVRHVIPWLQLVLLPVGVVAGYRAAVSRIRPDLPRRPILNAFGAAVMIWTVFGVLYQVPLLAGSALAGRGGAPSIVVAVAGALSLVFVVYVIRKLLATRIAPGLPARA